MSEPNDTTSEKFRTIPGFDQYKVSSLGRIVRHHVYLNGVDEWRFLATTPSKAGYPQVILCQDGKRAKVYVHRVLLEVFVGPCPIGMEACHNDGNPANVTLDNLRWDTRRNNLRDIAKHGKQAGSSNPMSKITEADAVEIRRMRFEGGTYRVIAERFGVSTGLVALVVTRKLWGHVPDQYGLSPEQFDDISRKNVSIGAAKFHGKLTEADVREIRRVHTEFGNYKDIARQYGVTEVSIGKIVRRDTWKHVT